MARDLGFTSDLKHCIALQDERARANGAARAKAVRNVELCALLLAEAQRRGRESIDWVEYFRNVGINYP